jgi:predicted transcriptional regulator
LSIEKKTKLVYGVEMTSLEEMHFAKFLANKGIAMNTKTKEERYSITKEWLDSHFLEVSKPKTNVQKKIKQF